VGGGHGEGVAADVEIGYIISRKINGEASTGRSIFLTIIEADRGRIVQDEVRCGLADKDG
jgi:hypothetical protein